MRIEPLADHPDLVKAVARGHWDEWGDPNTSTPGEWTESLRRRAETTFVAFDETGLLGSVTLTDHDMPGHDRYAELRPWIAGMLVRSDARGSGVGTALMRHACEQAVASGVDRLYLYTESARPFYERLGWTLIEETDWEGGRVAVMTRAASLPFFPQVPGSRRLSQRISEGDGISIIVCVDDADSARNAEAQGAEAVAVTAAIEGIRTATTLPLLWLGSEAPADADAVRVRPEDDLHDDLETVVDVRDEEELELALERIDPEIFLLSAEEIDEDVDPLDAVLELLPDVPAGKLAIARVDVESREEVLALERAGVDAVLVTARHVADLVGDLPLDV